MPFVFSQYAKKAALNKSHLNFYTNVKQISQNKKNKGEWKGGHQPPFSACRTSLRSFLPRFIRTEMTFFRR